MMGFLGSVKLTLIILTVITLLSILGTLAPDLDIYYHPSYHAVLALLAINIFACASRRIAHFRFPLSARQYGYVFSHAGILIILCGSLVSLVYGTRILTWIGPGESVDRITDHRGIEEMLGFSITLERFRLDVLPSGMPSEFTSDVIITRPDLPDMASAVTVNHPLKIDSYRIFQSSYRLHRIQTINLGLTGPGMDATQLQLAVPGSSQILTDQDGKTFSISALRYEPDFVIDGHGIGSRSPYPKNPAVQIVLQDVEGLQEERWLFMHHDRFHMSDTWRNISFRFESVDQIYDTGLEIVRDPGTRWVGAGAVILIAGLLLYLFPFFLTGGHRP